MLLRASLPLSLRFMGPPLRQETLGCFSSSVLAPSRHARLHPSPRPGQHQGVAPRVLWLKGSALIRRLATSSAHEWNQDDVELHVKSASLQQVQDVLAWESAHDFQNAMGSHGFRFHQWMSAALKQLGLASYCGFLPSYEVLNRQQRQNECLRLAELVATRQSSRTVLPVEAQPPQTPGRKEFRASFAVAAAAFASETGLPVVLENPENGQGSVAWQRVRSRRLTASAFARALGFFKGERQSLWEEKVGLTAPFPGNDATRWGSRMEVMAMDAYIRNTGNVVEKCSFATKRDDPAHDWIGASPDGLVQSAIEPNPGLVEIKCPYNRGRPDLAHPPEHAIWYYMPQIQGQMEMLDRDWCDLYVWTPTNGSSAFRIQRDRGYWAAVFDVLAEFWWAHVVPARQIQEGEDSQEDAEQRRSADLLQLIPPEHSQTMMLVEESMNMAEQAPRTFYAPLMSGVEDQ